MHMSDRSGAAGELYPTVHIAISIIVLTDSPRFAAGINKKFSIFFNNQVKSTKKKKETLGFISQMILVL